MDNLLERKWKVPKQSVSDYAAERSSVGVWMAVSNRSPAYSVARLIAIDAMQALGMDHADFRTRDKIITGIQNRVNGTLDAVDLQP